MTICLSDLWAIQKPEEYKLHFARWNHESHPLDVFVRDRQEWKAWQEFRPHNNAFNRPFIFSVAQFYHEPDVWIFGGIYRVLARHDDHYDVELCDIGQGFVGRLKIRLPYRDRATRVNFENHYREIEVAEILPEQYSGRAFPGLESIDLSFDELEGIVKKGRADWRAALAAVKGVYLISDAETGRRYVGSAYSDGGIWSRWCSYIDTGHGGNVELRVLVDDPTLDYARKNFRFTLLETRTMAVPDKTLIDRETFWKVALLSRGKLGLNRN